MSFAIKMQARGYAIELDRVAQECEEAARVGAQAGAQVLYDEVKKNVDGLQRHTGNLARSIYQAYSEDNSRHGYAVYHVSWNARKAPHGHLVEYGHLQRYKISFDPATHRFVTHKDKPLIPPRLVAARPFVRPAMARAEDAMRAAENSYLDVLSSKGVLT